MQVALLFSAVVLFLTFSAPSAAGQALEIQRSQDSTQSTTPVQVTDDSGRQVNLDAPAQRIISLAPSITELLFSIGVGDRVVGVIDYSNFPEQARELPIVGRHDLLDMEGIIALQPDLIVAWQTGNPRSSIQRLQELGFAVYIAEPSSLQSIAVQLEKLAILTGVDADGIATADEFQQELQEIAARYTAAERVSVFYQVWHSPLISVGGEELINDIISLCGGDNIFAELGVAPKVSTEAVLQHNPQVIIASGMDISRPEWLDDWLRWPSLRAVQQRHLYFIPPDLVQRHSLRALQGARLMCEHLDKARQ